jgi:uncharacterized membrane protein YcaP (DUF421 family)
MPDRVTGGDMDLARVFFSGWPSLLRILLVGVPTYLVVLAMLHFGGKHALAKTNAYGLVVTVALGSALASAVLTREVSLSDGVLAIGLLLALQYLLSTLVSRFSWVGSRLTQRPTMLVRNGRMLRRAMRKERVTDSEVLAAIRKHGIDSVEAVAAVVLETDGSFSVIRTVGLRPSALADVELKDIDEPPPRAPGEDGKGR